MINYTPFGHSDWQTIVSDIKKFGSAGKKTAVVSTINGDANVPFYKELGNQGVKAEDIPGRRLLGRRRRTCRPRYRAAGRPSRRLELFPVGRQSGQRRLHQRPGRPSPRTTSASPTTRWKPTIIGFNMWVKAVEKAGTTDPDAVIDCDRRRLGAQPLRRLFDHDAEPPHHQAGADRRNPGRRPVRDRLADLRASSSATSGPIILPDSKDLISDWRKPMSCGNFNVATGKCGGKG